MITVLWTLLPGAHLHDLAERYGKYKTIHQHFGRGAEAGVGERIFKLLIEDPDNAT